jgi:hypothetical protein
VPQERLRKRCVRLIAARPSKKASARFSVSRSEMVIVTIASSLHPFWVRNNFLNPWFRWSATTGYFLAALRAAKQSALRLIQSPRLITKHQGRSEHG